MENVIELTLLLRGLTPLLPPNAAHGMINGKINKHNMMVSG